MTQPNPDDQRGAADKAGAKKAADVGVLDVVEYTHTDPILGGEHKELGVVVAIDGEAVHVVPLAGYRVQVTPADVKRLSVDDV
jgi:hypothetical protein